MGKKANATLGEIMGRKGAESAKRGVDLKDLPDLLGEAMPKLEFHALGRVRLMRALRQRFGENFKSVPGIQHVIQQFDRESAIELAHHKIKMKLGRK